ncbi:RES family NAD+ phosphorylase [Inquilinus sp. YAF38]|uniref:RES family NAD+ phosphorylase n=1 Tax=Inquilinus sp. YAF38 TaxID=3233084 RepID=UPI003F8FE5F0
MPLPAHLPVVPFEGPVYRCHSLQHDYRYFGRGQKHRFDDPEGRFGVLYLGGSREAAFVETCLRGPDATLLSQGQLAERRISEVLLGPVRLLEAYGKGLVPLGLTALISATPETNYADTQAFAREVFEHPDQVDGIAYLCRHDNEQRSIALFDRAEAKLLSSAAGGPMIEADWLGAMLDRYRVGLRP